jgi:hypothetical protein
MPAEKPDPSPDAAAQQRDIEKTGMICRYQDPACPRDVPASDRSIPETEAADRSEHKPQQPIDDSAHNLAAIIAIISSTT